MLLLGAALGVALVRGISLLLRWLLTPLRLAEARASRRGEEAAERVAWLAEMAEHDVLLTVPTVESVELSVVVPAFNERDRLPLMLRDCAEFLLSWKTSYEVVIIDDGSTDNTAVVAQEVGAALFPAGVVRVARLSRNRGKGGAVREGALRTRGHWILLCDADGATRFADLQRLWTAGERSTRPTIVVGSRAHLVHTDVVAKRSPLRNLLMRGFHFFVACVGGVSSARDTQCGFKLLQRTALPALAGLHLERWAFDVELLFLAQRLQFAVVEVDVQWVEIPGSKLNLFRDSIQMARDILCLRLAYTFGLWQTPDAATT